MVIDEKMWFCWELGEADASDQKAFGGSILGYELDGRRQLQSSSPVTVMLGNERGARRHHI
jgi:hypothetical protein